MIKSWISFKLTESFLKWFTDVVEVTRDLLFQSLPGVAKQQKGTKEGRHPNLSTHMRNAQRTGRETFWSEKTTCGVDSDAYVDGGRFSRQDLFNDWVDYHPGEANLPMQLPRNNNHLSWSFRRAGSFFTSSSCNQRSRRLVGRAYNHKSPKKRATTDDATRYCLLVFLSVF